MKFLFYLIFMTKKELSNEYELKKDYLLSELKNHEVIYLNGKKDSYSGDKYKSEFIALSRDEYKIVYKPYLVSSWDRKQISYNKALRLITIEAIRRVNEDYAKEQLKKKLSEL